eukprot:15155392-Heterocapsa_arctica.AAC.1
MRHVQRLEVIGRLTHQGDLRCTLRATREDWWRPGRQVGQYGLMDFLSEPKAELSDLGVMMEDQLYETFDDGDIAKKDRFVVDLGRETYVYSPALRVPVRRDLGGV